MLCGVLHLLIVIEYLSEVRYDFNDGKRSADANKPEIYLRFFWKATVSTSAILVVEIFWRKSGKIVEITNFLNQNGDMEVFQPIRKVSD